MNHKTIKFCIAFCIGIAFAASAKGDDAADMIYAAWKQEQQILLRHNLDDMCIRQGTDSMKFTMKFFGEKPHDGWSLWISLHGGGGVPADVNDQQWENQKILYKPKEGIYVCPRAPRNLWNMWCTDSIDPMYEELIRTLVVCEDVNPDKVYINGYSAGGDGVWRLAPRMADRWAAAAMMAGHPGDVRLENVRNLPFTIWVGSEDYAYDRNKLVPLRGLQLDSLQNNDPEGYIHETHVMEGLPHWMMQRDTIALDWMRQFRRNPHPKRVVWRQEEVLKQWFYWLEAPKDELERGKTIVAEIKSNTIYITRCDYSRLTLYLADDMLDLNRRITIVMPDGRKKTVKPHRSDKTLRETLTARADKGYMFPVRIESHW